MIRIDSVLERLFRIKKHSSTIKTEIIAGISLYFTTVYIIFLVPTIVMQVFPNAYSADGRLIEYAIVYEGIAAGHMLTAITIATCLTAGIATIFMGLVVNVPFAQGPSLACTTFLVYTVSLEMGYSFYEVLALVFLSGIMFLIMTVCGIEDMIQEAIPDNLKYAVSCGIGLLIAFTGFKKAHIVEASDVDLIKFFEVSNFSSLTTKSAILTIVSVIFTAILLKKHVHGAILIGKFVCTVVAVPLGILKLSELRTIDFNLTLEPILMKMDFASLFLYKPLSNIDIPILSILLIVISICVMDVFETIGTLIATETFLTIRHYDDKTKNNKLHRIFGVDAITTTLGSMMGALSVSTYVESASAIVDGGRTGATAVVCGILFLLTIPLAPVASVIPAAATAVTLIISGVLMMSVIKFIDFNDISEALPAFLAMVLIPFTNSLMTGIALGLISYPVIQVFTGQRKKVKPTTYLLAMLFCVQLFFTY